MAYLSRLRLTNFRNLTGLDLELSPGVSVYFGPNAQGKTTLLEAVYLLSIARSFRAENERELVNFEAARAGEQALVDGTVEGKDERLRVIVGYQTLSNAAAAGNGMDYSVRKEIRVNRLRRTAADLVGAINAVLFSALDIELVMGAPAGRRRFLDILISQADNRYLRSLQRFNKVLQQRNQLLRLLRDGRAEAGELAFWDDQLILEGSWVTWRRHEIMGEVAAACLRHHESLGGEHERLALEYRPSVPPAASLEEMEDSFRQALTAAAPREKAQALTAVGPHRDDFDLSINGTDMGAFASRGQARTLALSLRLAEAEVLAAVRFEGPIVLLDDALSEIDRSRRHRVLEKASQYQQVLITTTDLDQVSGYFGAKAAYHQVDGGTVTPYDLESHGANGLEIPAFAAEDARE